MSNRVVMRMEEAILKSDSIVRWATAVSKDASNGRSIVFRFAQELSPGFARSSQPDRIILVWRYESETGQPVRNEHVRMDTLEDLLEPVLEVNNCATLALVSTGENLREWIYYARSEDEFLDKLNFALAGYEPFPIEIYTAKDPEWSDYEEFRQRVRDPSKERSSSPTNGGES